MLIGVEALGFVGKGAQRWIDLGPIRLQPSEFMKPAIVTDAGPLLRAASGRRHPQMARDLARRWRCSACPAFLILVQPDLGTCIMVILCGVDRDVPRRDCRWWLFAGPGGGASRSPRRSPTVMLHGYQRKRIDIFLDPESDPLGAGYHIAQSKIAIGSGGILGQGLPQRQPEPPRLSSRRAIPTSSSRPWPRNGALLGGCC